MNEAKLLEQFEYVINSAYQDMEGFLSGKKNYRLRQRELAEKLLEMVKEETDGEKTS